MISERVACRVVHGDGMELTCGVDAKKVEEGKTSAPLKFDESRIGNKGRASQVRKCTHGILHRVFFVQLGGTADSGRQCGLGISPGQGVGHAWFLVWSWTAFAATTVVDWRRYVLGIKNRNCLYSKL